MEVRLLDHQVIGVAWYVRNSRVNQLVSTISRMIAKETGPDKGGIMAYVLVLSASISILTCSSSDDMGLGMSFVTAVSYFFLLIDS
jgi:hypothetical protein